MIKVSFDFDGTLHDNDEVQSLAAELSKDPSFELYITTRRYSHTDERRDVMIFAEVLGIPNERITFTDRDYKYPYLVSAEIDIHLDDDLQECMHVWLGDNMSILWIGHEKWIDMFNYYVNELKEAHKK